MATALVRMGHCRLHPQFCDAKVVLLTVTPCNKTKADLSSQLRLFIDEKANIGIRPEHLMRKQDVTEAEFERKHQCKVWDPRPEMLKHFKKARGWRYDDKVDAIRVLKASAIDMQRMRRSTSFARFEAKLLACGIPRVLNA